MTTHTTTATMKAIVIPAAYMPKKHVNVQLDFGIVNLSWDVLRMWGLVHEQISADPEGTKEEATACLTDECPTCDSL